ncbi:MAG: TlyA family RNA methyltransferase [Nitrospiraceae bacterium]|jgi:23S rRNA (cytidine1920-2'-O)/16S rRNA (cytidine1409-2'-O)-methyltransferase|uniref:TlyA family RNA methyltransferase n=1 Tax=Nitrospira cf. moscoviensis SBR1015 TaxID=96242 RepID=UPI000A0C142E|nr:TlyA family RNA methyltransferase [Nitrospira cf. moscoviensis SBR1015]MBY0248888.1 TlyA family RNA methyltransferase [Nitrospiraceae bacterium]OQW34640.1 MAG: rRNA methyltransferase [Nitrospira sp. SG-bin2]
MGTKAYPQKARLDQRLVAQGLAPSREAAARMILAGEVRVNGAMIDKPAKAVSVEAAIDIVSHGSRFVSRGGDKLAAALDASGTEPRGLVCLDVGCSTGGFTDCLLQRGATRIYAVDVGYGQFDWRLRQDPRVVLIERTNIRYIERSAVPEPIALTVIDVSFISLTNVLPSILPFLAPNARVIALVKPQFEVGKGQVGRGGIVRDETQRQAVLQRIVRHADELGLRVLQTLDCPVKGKKGNHEMLAIFELTARFHGM